MQPRRMFIMFSAISIVDSNNTNIKQVLLYTFLCLLFGHFVLRDYMPSQLVAIFGFSILILLYVCCIKKDAFGFILVVFLCSHFVYANNQGGLWNLLTFGPILFYYLFIKPTKVFKKPDVLINLLVSILVITDILGYTLKNQMPLVPKLLGAAIFLSYILMYYLASNQLITSNRAKCFILATGFAIVCMFFAGLNQKNAFIKFNTPLLGGYSAGSGGTIVHAVLRGGSTLKHTELFAEYAMLTIVLLIPLMTSGFTQCQLRIKGYMVGLTLLFSLGNILLSGTRAPFILAALSAILYLIIFTVFPLAIVDTRIGYMFYVVATIIFIFIFGRFLGLNVLKQRMGEGVLGKVTVEAMLSGKNINRGRLFTFALKRLQKVPWYIGYGCGVPDSNRFAWFGKKMPSIAGFHSLYFSLPMIYGWFGSVAFLLIIIVTFNRLAYVVCKYRWSENYLVTLSLGFTFFWVFFLVDQYKISILRMPNYHMLFWIWLGLSNAIVKTLKISSCEPISGNMSKQGGLVTGSVGLGL